MRHIDITTKKPKPEWLKKAKSLTEDLQAIDSFDDKMAFIDKNQKLWGELKEFLKALSYGKCWYSEAKDTASYLHVDHFRPKAEIKDLDGEFYEGYWWLAFEWTNYRLAGGAVNTPKSSKFPVRSGTDWASSSDDDINDEEPYLLDPTNIADPGLLTFDEEGMPKPLDASNRWNKERVEVSIDILNLKYDDLVQARKQVWFECDKEINTAVNLMKDIQRQRSVTKRTKLNSAVKKIKEMVYERAPFSSIATACLETQGIPWLTRMVFMN